MISGDTELEKYRNCLKSRELLEGELKKRELTYSQVMEKVKRLQRIKYYIEWYESVNIAPSFTDPDQLSF